MSVKKNLIAARALIDTPEKWVKIEYEDHGCFCALGALGRVMGRDPSGDLGEVEIALGRALPPDFKLSAVLSLGTNVVMFNDHPDTTHADIMAMFDRAIEACND